MRISWMVLLFTSAVVWGGCTGPSTLMQGKNSSIRYQQVDRNTGVVTLEMVLVDEKNEHYENLYSETKNRANIKKVPSPLFSDLLQSLEDLDFMEKAQSTAVGLGQSTGYSKKIILENSLGRWVLVSTEKDPLEEHRIFGQMVMKIRQCFDSTFDLQVVENKDGKNLFLEEQRILKEEEKRRLKDINKERYNP